MYSIYKDGIVTECHGNVEFSPTIYQRAETLTAAQREALSVYEVVDVYPEITPASGQKLSGDYTVSVAGQELTRTWGVVDLTAEELADRQQLYLLGQQAECEAAILALLHAKA